MFQYSRLKLKKLSVNISQSLGTAINANYWWLKFKLHYTYRSAFVWQKLSQFCRFSVVELTLLATHLHRILWIGYYDSVLTQEDKYELMTLWKNALCSSLNVPLKLIQCFFTFCSGSHAQPVEKTAQCLSILSDIKKKRRCHYLESNFW